MTKLKREFAIFAIIALFISIFVGVKINEMILREWFPKGQEEKFQIIYRDYVENIINLVIQKDINNKLDKEYIANELKENFKLSKDNLCRRYIVNKQGEVILSINDEVRFINPVYIRDGFRELKYNKFGINKIIGCNYIKDDYYIFYDYFGYMEDDSKGVIYGIIIFLIIFGLMSSGRLTYLLKIKSSIRVIATGDLNYKIPLKYKNELTELAQDINYMASELQHEDEKRKEFLTNISHDLRTPLTTVLGYIKIIKEEKYDNKEELNNYIEVMNRKGLFLKSMLDDFFQYSKLSSRDFELNKQSIYLQELIRQIVEEEEFVFKEKNINLSLTLIEETINVYGDGELLVRAVNNLLSNAFKYSKEGTNVVIKVDKKSVNNKVYGVISVSNITKENVSEDEIHKLFERLYKKDKSRNEDGSGLGLAIVKEITSIHNGFVRVCKEENRIVFKIFLSLQHKLF